MWIDRQGLIQVSVFCANFLWSYTFYLGRIRLAAFRVSGVKALKTALVMGLGFYRVCKLSILSS